MSEYKYQHGLSIMRAQPFHIGHQKLVDRMLKECERVTIVLGSIQEQGTARNPLNYTTRKKMIQNIYRSRPEYERLKIIGLFDINNPAEWGEYVLDFIAESFQTCRGRMRTMPVPATTRTGFGNVFKTLSLKTGPTRIFRSLQERWYGI